MKSCTGDPCRNFMIKYKIIYYRPIRAGISHSDLIELCIYLVKESHYERTAYLKNVYF
jgi:hypothetical protein